MRRFDEALLNEQERVRALTNLESKARAIRRALLLIDHARSELVAMRTDLIAQLRDRGWTLKSANDYFGLRSR